MIKYTPPKGIGEVLTSQDEKDKKTSGFNFMTQGNTNPDFVDPNWESKGGGENVNTTELLNEDKRNSTTAIANNRFGEETNPVIAEWNQMKHDKVMTSPVVQYTPAAIAPYGIGIAENLYKGVRGIFRGDYGDGINQLAKGGVKAAIGTAVEKLPFHKIGHGIVKKVAPYTKEVIPVLKKMGNKAFNSGVTAVEKGVHHAVEGAVVGHKRGGIIYKCGGGKMKCGGGKIAKGKMMKGKKIPKK